MPSVPFWQYNPLGESRLREIFLKTDNFIQGRYDLVRAGWLCDFE